MRAGNPVRIPKPTQSWRAPTEHKTALYSPVRISKPTGVSEYRWTATETKYLTPVLVGTNGAQD